MEGNTVESRFEDILSLVIARSRGEVGNEEVENALASIIPSSPPIANNDENEGLNKNSSDAAPAGTNGIIQDTDNYDFDDDAPSEPNASFSANTQELQRRGRPKSTEAAYESLLDDIPLGIMGSRMLITFGDGPQPRPAVVSAALLGARSSLQRAVLDARALHRRLKDQWQRARAVARQHGNDNKVKQLLEKTTGAVSNSDIFVDSESSFLALKAHGISYDIPCGFDVKSLEKLFPEEMNAYQRWKKLHQAYKENSNEDMKSLKDEAEDETTNNADSNSEKDNDANNTIEKGRLYERLSNFDVRTNYMGQDSYMRFSDIRKGSFLPRKRLTDEKKEFVKTNKKRGRPSTKERTTWANLHPSSVVFLHWLGFDPMSSLPPPNEETTQALGFLAHDFLGKIVEKAVVIRLKELNDNSRLKKGILPELSGDDQLEVKDIERAISEACLKSLYTSSETAGAKPSQVAQLYFGPGFEDRLELELEEIFGAKDKRLTPEELKVRQEEEALFSGLSGPPSIPSSLTKALDTRDNENNDANETQSARKVQRTEDGPQSLH